MPALVRGLLAVAAGLVVAVQVVRVAGVAAFSFGAPEVAGRFWPGHPSVEFGSGLVEIANAAREGQPVDQAAIDRMLRASVQAPLSEEPFLVRGVQAQLAGDTDLARRAFVAARWRDGRSLPARYFLAEHYLRSGDAAHGLAEIGALSRLVPGGVASMAPYVAAFSRMPANRARVRALLRDEPSLEEATLVELSKDAGNAALVLALADKRRMSAKSGWLPGLLSALVNAGEYRMARQAWAEASRVRADPSKLLFYPAFEPSHAPPPFNWALASSTLGLADRMNGGGLHVIYYGQQDGALASQLLILDPGSYRLAAEAAGDLTRATALRWRLVCASTNQELGSAPLTTTQGDGWLFRVAAGCPAQRLELFATAEDLPRQTEVTIKAVRLTRAG